MLKLSDADSVTLDYIFFKLTQSLNMLTLFKEDKEAEKLKNSIDLLERMVNEIDDEYRHPNYR